MGKLGRGVIDSQKGRERKKGEMAVQIVVTPPACDGNTPPLWVIDLPHPDVVYHAITHRPLAEPH